jgi:transketolase
MESTAPANKPLSRESRAARMLIVEMVHRSGASHIASSLSAVEILTAVYDSVDIEKIRNRTEDRDRVIVSKGHAAAALYAVLFQHGLMGRSALNTYCMNDSLLSGHVSHFVPYVEHSTGALGHGLSVGVGIAIGLRSRGLSSSRAYVVVGDGEMHEGSNWEALMLAAHHGLSNLCVLIDNNHLGGVGRTDECCSLREIKRMLEGFGLAAFGVDGHDVAEIRAILEQTRRNVAQPVAVICQTVKGKGVSFMEGNNVWHYRPPNAEAYQKALLELQREC